MTHWQFVGSLSRGEAQTYLKLLDDWLAGKNPDATAYDYYWHSVLVSNFARNPSREESDLLRASELDPGNVDVWVGLGHLARSRRQFDKAIAYYDRGIQALPTDFFPWYGRAGAFMELGRFGEALHDVDHAISIRPTLTYGYELRALVHERMGNFECALADANTAVESDASCEWTSKLQQRVRQKLAQGGTPSLPVERSVNKVLSNPETTFYAKSWYIYVAAIVFTILTVFCAVFGPLFLFGIVKPADGKPGTDAGIAMSIMAVPMCLVALLGWFNVYARRMPLLRICEEGLEINVIGALSLDGVPLIPVLIRVAWLIASLQGFRKQIGCVPWELFRTVRVAGLPMCRSLVIDATIVYPTFRGDEITATVAECVAFRDAEFRAPLETIASAILAYYDNPAARTRLPSLHD